ncbi:J domain-containing protein [Mycobacterium sp. pUA109]|uniref:J domain-containing protein n=1 Tax=Mycobacterium sp. pUA109 TaxID=3238982 RepID=UPI00351B2F99
MTDPYAVLAVPPTATQAEITRAYRRQLRDHHPDLRVQGPNSGAEEQLRQILAAYAVLRDPRRRADYDRTHRTHQRPAPVQITVSHTAPAEDAPPLRAGPVHWQR